MLKRPCRFYNSTGKCRFGERCKFSHEVILEQNDLLKDQDEISVSKPDTGVADPVVDNSSPLESPNKENEGLNKESTPKFVKSSKVCEFYSKNKFCKYGKRCKYQHVRGGKLRTNQSKTSHDLKKNRQNEEQNKVQDEIEEDDEKEVENAPETVTEDQGDVVKETSNRVRKICYFYKQGYCKFGKRCRFYHPNRNNDTTADDPDDSKVKDATSQDATVPSNNEESWRSVSRAPRVIHVYKRSEVTQDKIMELRKLEMTNLKRRFPSHSLKVMEEVSEAGDRFAFTFVPSDPDWPYDANAFKMEIFFPENYPMKLFSVTLPCEQDLPETVRRYIEVTVQEWIQQREEDAERKDCMELLLRPFMRWLDRNMEDTVTQALKQLRRELAADAAGLQFISAKDLKNDLDQKFTTDRDQKSSSDELSTEEDQYPYGEEAAEGEREMTVYKKGEINEDEVYMGPSKTEITDDEDDEDDEDENPTETSNVHQRPKIDLDTPRRGTEMAFRTKDAYFMTSLLVEKLRLSVQCERCKHVTDFSTPPNRVSSVQCAKCHVVMLAVYRPVLYHCYSSTFGYLDLDGCVAHDVILQDCHMSIGCVKCNRDELVKKYSPGQTLEKLCRVCHTRLRFIVESVKLSKLGLSSVDSSEYSGKVFHVDVKPIRRAVKDPAIQEGRPLPDNGVCKHYKKSFRWFRFPCCGKCYPCDVCHDSKEDHDMKYANRMVCGYCCHEQPYASDRPCTGCGSALTRVRTAHWEGGRGCRDKVTMSCMDDKKYANTNKTVSTKARLLEEKKRGKKKSK